MKTCLLAAALMMTIAANAQGQKTTEKHDPYMLSYASTEKSTLTKIRSALDEGVVNAEKFFKQKYTRSFSVRIHPDRHTLDSTWAVDWNSPGLKSECWQVASGVATTFDILDPSTWGRDACDHDPKDDVATAEIIRHELVHVFHGQHNPSPDFADVQGLDWFVEGLAVYASGQLTEEKAKPVREMVVAKKYPATLDDFWKGKTRYYLSGSVVKYIDEHYGRKMLISLLSATRKEALLQKLGTTENELIAAWASWLK